MRMERVGCREPVVLGEGSIALGNTMASPYDAGVKHWAVSLVLEDNRPLSVTILEVMVIF